MGALAVDQRRRQGALFWTLHFWLVLVFWGEVDFWEKATDSPLAGKCSNDAGLPHRFFLSRFVLMVTALLHDVTQGLATCVAQTTHSDARAHHCRTTHCSLLRNPSIADKVPHDVIGRYPNEYQ